MGQTAIRVLVTDFMGETDLEREVLPGVEVESLLMLVGHAPTPADLLRVVEERPAGALIAWHEMVFSASTLARLGRAGVRGRVRAGPARLWAHRAGGSSPRTGLRLRRALVRSVRAARPGQGDAYHPGGEPARPAGRRRCPQHPLSAQRGDAPPDRCPGAGAA